jgi:hypothetical protein
MNLQIWLLRTLETPCRKLSGMEPRPTTRQRRPFAVAHLVFVAVAFAGCASPNSGVRGDLRYVGGPTIGPRPAPGHVTAYSADGSEAASAEFGEGKTFEIPLEAGTYRLVFASGSAQCPDQSVTVAPDTFEAVRELCDVI